MFLTWHLLFHPAGFLTIRLITHLQQSPKSWTSILSLHPHLLQPKAVEPRRLASPTMPPFIYHFKRILKLQAAVAVGLPWPLVWLAFSSPCWLLFFTLSALCQKLWRLSLSGATCLSRTSTRHLKALKPRVCHSNPHSWASAERLIFGCVAHKEVTRYWFEVKRDRQNSIDEVFFILCAYSNAIRSALKQITWPSLAAYLGKWQHSGWWDAWVERWPPAGRTPCCCARLPDTAPPSSWNSRIGLWFGKPADPHLAGNQQRQDRSEMSSGEELQSPVCLPLSEQKALPSQIDSSVSYSAC